MSARVGDSVSVKPLRGWFAWAALLLVAFVAFQWVAWQRTLISTEIWALYYAGRPLNEQLHAIRDDLVHPPLMYLIERGWLSTFGQTDSAAKALPLIINIPTLFIFTWLASCVTRHWRLASFLFASVYFRVGSAPNQVRMYGLGLLLSVMVILLWEKWREKPSPGRLLAWTVISLLLVYTHLFGLLFLVAFVVVNWLYGSRRWVFTMAAAIPALAFLPWLFYVLPIYSARGLDANLTWVNKELHRAVIQLPYGFLGPIHVGGFRPSFIVASAVLHLLLFALAWRTIRRIWPPRRSGDETARWFWTLALLIGVPVGLLFIFSAAVTPAFQERFVLGLLPMYWLLLVLLGQLGGRPGRLVLYGVVLPWVLLSIGSILVEQLPTSLARQGTLLLSQRALPGDLILCEGQDLANQVYWEWTRRLGRSGRIEVLQPPSPVVRLSVLPPKNLDTLELAGVERVWFFSSTGSNTASVTEFLKVRGFAFQKQLPAEAPFLLAFAK